MSLSGEKQQPGRLNGMKENVVVPGGGMNFELTDDQELIRKSVAELVAKFDDHYWMERTSRTSSRRSSMTRSPRVVGSG